MQVKFWGTRGSLPRATSTEQVISLLDDAMETAKSMGINDFDGFKTALKSGVLTKPVSYGGNTSCTQVSMGRDSVYVDAGTGLSFAGDTALAQNIKDFHIFQTHFHWDHIMGLPFFVPLYIPGMRVHIYHVHRTGPEDIKIQFNGRNFPVTWDRLGASVEFHCLKPYESVQVGALTATPFVLDHPGGAFGFRVEGGGKSISVGVDGEYKRFTPKELGQDLKFYQNLDVLVFDGQYELDELVSRYDWGHCTPTIGVDLAIREGIRNLVLTHHDPRSNEAKIRRMLADARSYLKSVIHLHSEQWTALGQPEGPHIESAYDGMIIQWNKSKAEYL